MTECTAEQSYPLSDVQKQRLAIESLLGEPSPSWLTVGVTVEGVAGVERFRDALLELPRAYPVLRTSFVTDGPADSWYQQVRSCDEIFRGRSPVTELPESSSWEDLLEAMRPNLEQRNPDYGYSAAYSLQDAGRIHAVIMFDHMVFDLKSIDIVLAQLARTVASEDEPDLAQACRCGANEFAPYLKRTAVIAGDTQLSERYEWAHELMLAARSPHGFVSLPLTAPLTVKDAGGATQYLSSFTTPAGRRHPYTPFIALTSALALSLATNFDSPAMFYTPTLNREPAEMGSVGWFAGTPMMPVRSARIMPALDAGQIADEVLATSETKAATTETMRNGQLLTTLIHRKLGAVLDGRMPYADCLSDSLPYIVLGYADHVRRRESPSTDGVVITRVPLPETDLLPPLIPPGYIFIRLSRVEKTEWLVQAIYEAERYEGDAMETLLSSMERYLKDLLGRQPPTSA